MPPPDKSKIKEELFSELCLLNASDLTIHLAIERGMVAFNRGITTSIHDTAFWIRCQYPHLFEDPLPDSSPEIARRLKDGEGKRCLFLPFLGEFGHLLMSHIRFTHFHSASEKIVCCRPGEECLFPSASSFVTDWSHPFPDNRRIGSMRGQRFTWPELCAQFPDAWPVQSGNWTPVEELITIQPSLRLPFKPQLRGLRVDVCIGVRNRTICPERNWRHWQRLADAITANGNTFAIIGIRPTAPDLVGQTYHTSDYDTDAAIELLQSCSLYVGQDSGNSHLAAAAGASMLIFREENSGSQVTVP